MEKWQPRAKQLLKARGITHGMVAQRLKCGTGAVSHKLNERRETTLDEIEIIAEMLGLSVPELLLGDPAFARTEEEIEVIDTLRQLDPDERAKAVRMLKAMYK